MLRKKHRPAVFFLFQIVSALLLLSAAVSAQDRTVEWRGVINALPGTTTFIGEWTVNNRKVVVNDKTVLKQERGKIEVGAFVELKGTAAAGNETTITATSLEVQLSPSVGIPVAIKGTVESLPNTTGRIGEWKISGKTVKVSTTTRLVAPPSMQFAVGSAVEGAGLQATDGTITAALLVLKVETPASPVSSKNCPAPKVASAIGRSAVASCA